MRKNCFYYKKASLKKNVKTVKKKTFFLSVIISSKLYIQLLEPLYFIEHIYKNRKQYIFFKRFFEILINVF